MSVTYASCPDCRWRQSFRRAGRARREAGSHRCRPRRARPLGRKPRTTARRLARLLNSAATAAAAQEDARAAVATAEAVLDRDHRRARGALAAWCASELYSGDPAGLAAALRGRYGCAAEVTASLRAAAGRLLLS
jgi:hypothetical protein